MRSFVMGALVGALAMSLYQVDMHRKLWDHILLLQDEREVVIRLAETTIGVANACDALVRPRQPKKKSRRVGD